MENAKYEISMQNLDEKHRKKVLALLGFAKKSGNTVSGTEIVIKNINKQKLVLLASDCSQGQAQKILRACKLADVRCYTVFDREELSRAIGEVNRVCVGIKEMQFAGSIEKYILQGEA